MAEEQKYTISQKQLEMIIDTTVKKTIAVFLGQFDRCAICDEMFLEESKWQKSTNTTTGIATGT